MACPEWKSRLTDWILEELSSAEGQEVERHVKGCADCSRSLAGLQRTIHFLKTGLPDLEMPARLVFHEEKRRAQSVSFLVSLWRTAALAGVAAVVFLGIVLGGYSRWEKPRTPPVTVTNGGLTRAEVEDLVENDLAKELQTEKQELREASEQSAASFRQAQARNLQLVASKLDYLESAQYALWKDTQEQDAKVELIAGSMLSRQVAPTRDH
jgi:putative zinc finger protein